MQVLSRNLTGDISLAMEEYATKKLEFPEFGVNDMKIVVSSIGEEIFIKANFSDNFNHHYNLSVNKPDYYEAIDTLKDLAFSALTKRKQKLASQRDRDIMQNDLPDIVREKILIASQMSYEKAILEMEELGHDFFVFRNDDNDIAILYNRYDGDLGVIVVK